ncbi:MAG TPA: mandelate racemase/muconate lactonizing enzyme family protein [Xanthobacteraceae bacterium]|nr:mandelate racemase/muconate lactonizing enzyme family protein [Xanthobacteraceae bacterium]
MMRLRDHRLYTYRLRYAQPVRWSDIVEDAAPFVLLRLIADDGSEGVAEITVKPTWCGVSARSLIAAIDDIFIPILKKLDLDDSAGIRAAFDIVPENQAAKMLIDNACWDLQAARQGRPLWQIWNGHSRVELSWAVTRQEPRAMADEAARMIGTYGFRTLKVKGGQGIAKDIAVIREIRTAAGDEIRLYVDANGAYSLAEASDYASALADCGIVLLEDPCPLAPDRHFGKLRRDSPIPILVDFGCSSLRDAHLFIEQGAQALSVKPGRFGLTHARTMRDMAEQKRCDVVVGLMGESALGTLAGLQFASTIADPILPAELTWFMAMTEQVISQVPPIVDGSIKLTESPSLAALIDWKAVEASR